MTPSAPDAARRRRASPWTRCSPPSPSATAATREREHGALRAADDAVEIDTSELRIDEVVERVVELARERGLA